MKMQSPFFVPQRIQQNLGREPIKKRIREWRWKSAKDGFSDRRNKNSNRMVAKFSGVPTGIRTPVPTVKGLCPRPLDDGDPEHLTVVEVSGFEPLTPCMPCKCSTN